MEVVNASCTGWSTREEVAVLRARGAKARPDVVVLAFYVGNDLWDNAHERSFTAVAGFRVQTTSPVCASAFRRFGLGLVRFAYDVSALARWVRFGRVSLEDRDPRLGLAAGRQAFHEYWIFCTREPERLRPDQRARVERGLRESRRLLGEFRDVSRALGAVPIVAILPERTQILEPARRDRILAVARVPAEALDLERPQVLVRDLCRGLGLSFVDLEAEFAARGLGSDLFWEVDIHWNAAGHRAAAEVLYDALLERFATGLATG
jgi:hypothetical protein